MSSPPLPTISIFLALFIADAVASAVTPSSSSSSSADPTPAPWPHQFHSVLLMNNSGKNLQMIDLWYDWTNGRNFNIIRDQLSSSLLYDLEWNNGTSFIYTLDDDDSPTCRVLRLDVGILRPDWLDGAEYLGQRNVNGFLCNLWTKVDFIWYYEDVVTKRPVLWVFYSGREAHVMTFEVGAAMEDEKWQAPVYCFNVQVRDDSGIVDVDSSSGLSMSMIRVGGGDGDGDGGGVID